MEAVTRYPKAIRIVIPGAFWDSQLYSGTLYLFGVSGELRTLSWEKLIADLPVPETLRIAANFAFLGNHRLYEPGARQLLGDPDIRRVLLAKFLQLGAMPAWEVGLNGAHTQDNPLPFPHNDSDVHYHNLYVGSSQGLHSLTTGERRGVKDGVRLSDVPALHIAARLSTMAHASGDDGLFAIGIADESDSLNGHVAREVRVSALPCMTCEWAFASVVAAGFDHSVYIAPFDRVLSPPVNGRRGRRSVQRQFDRIIQEPDIFKGEALQHRGFTWGAGDKIFRFGEGHIGVVQYTPHPKKQATFAFKGNILVDDTDAGASVVAARAASFGSVVERDDALLVLLTTGESLTLSDEPTNWRVFPRSKNYVNHLHVIYEDRLEVWAFTHDYFTDQKKKLAGIGVGTSE